MPCPQKPSEVSTVQMGTKGVDATSREALATDFEALDKSGRPEAQPWFSISVRFPELSCKLGGGEPVPTLHPQRAETEYPASQVHMEPDLRWLRRMETTGPSLHLSSGPQMEPAAQAQSHFILGTALLAPRPGPRQPASVQEHYTQSQAPCPVL